MKFVNERVRNWFPLARTRRAIDDQKGIAAIEFGLILPIAALLLAAGVDYSDAIAIQRKITSADRTITDLVTQYTTMDTGTLAVNLAAAASIIAPYSSSNLVMTVSEVTTNSGGGATVVWSQSFNGTRRVPGSTLALPVTIPQINATLILGEVQYNYVPLIGYTAVGSFTLKDTTVMSPRLVTNIPCATCS
jgi:Flp pilus assembly protein TadG